MYGKQLFYKRLALNFVTWIVNSFKTCCNKVNKNCTNRFHQCIHITLWLIFKATTQLIT